VRWQRVKW